MRLFCVEFFNLCYRFWCRYIVNNVYISQAKTYHVEKCLKRSRKLVVILQCVEQMLLIQMQVLMVTEAVVNIEDCFLPSRKKIHLSDKIDDYLSLFKSDKAKEKNYIHEVLSAD